MITLDLKALRNSIADIALPSGRNLCAAARSNGLFVDTDQPDDTTLYIHVRNGTRFDSTAIMTLVIHDMAFDGCAYTDDIDKYMAISVYNMAIPGDPRGTFAVPYKKYLFCHDAANAIRMFMNEHKRELGLADPDMPATVRSVATMLSEVIEHIACFGGDE